MKLYWQDKGARLLRRWILLGLVLLAIFGFLTFGTSLVFPDRYGYVDFAAGRRRVVDKRLGFVTRDVVRETEFTRLYHQYVSDTLPIPKWWIDNQNEGRGPVKLHLSSYRYSVIYITELMIEELQANGADEELKRWAFLAIVRILREDKPIDWRSTRAKSYGSYVRVVARDAKQRLAMGSLLGFDDFFAALEGTNSATPESCLDRLDEAPDTGGEQ